MEEAEIAGVLCRGAEQETEAAGLLAAPVITKGLHLGQTPQCAELHPHAH